jgi:two-component system sensor histidine kinase ChvG
LRQAGRHCRPSLTTGLIGLAVLLATLPIAYYDQLRQNELKYASMLRLWSDNEGRLAARTLAPLLSAPGATPFRVVDEQLATLAAPGRRLYLMLRPAEAENGAFYLVASAPRISQNGLEAEWQQWHDRAGWPNSDTACAPAGPGPTVQSGSEPLPATIRSIVPIPTPRGCWMLITAFDTEYLNDVVEPPKTSWLSIGGAAAGLYIAAIALAVLMLFRSWQGLNQLSRVAREISERGLRPQPFARGNKVPELAGVATDFDRLVTALQAAAESVRRDAEDNAHALKTPLATIRHSLTPIKRSIPGENDRAKRAVDLIEQSIVRLEALVSSAQPDPTRQGGPDAVPRPIDLSETVATVLQYYRRLLAGKNIAVGEHIEAGVKVEAIPGTVEAILNNIVDNAISFTPAGGEITIRLVTVARYCELTIEDTGPGVDPADLERIFDRYVSLRRTRVAASGASPLDNLHSGLGLWIVRRNVESMGGTVMAANRPQGGLSIRISLPTLA